MKQDFRALGLNEMRLAGAKKYVSCIRHTVNIFFGEARRRSSNPCVLGVLFHNVRSIVPLV